MITGQEKTTLSLNCSYDAGYADTGYYDAYQPLYDINIVYYDEDEDDDVEAWDDLSIPLPASSGHFCRHQSKMTRSTSNHHH